MNSIGVFTINPKNTKILNDNEMDFIEELESSGEIGYEFPHYYSDGKITGYRALTIEIDSNKNKEAEKHIDYINELYGIKPNIIYSKDNIEHYVFYFVKSLNSFDFNRVSKGLEFLYKGSALSYHFYPLNGINVQNTNEEISEIVLEVGTKMYFYLEQERKYQKKFTINDFNKYQEVNNLSIVDVLEALYEKQTELLTNSLKRVDIKNNIHIDNGRPFDVVNKYFGLEDKAKDFFIEKFNIEFDETNSLSYENSKDGVVLKESENIYIDNSGYFTLTPTGDKKKLTDFYIKVHSKIIHENGKYNFVVSLINQEQGIETKKIIWENKTSANQFSDFIQSYGNFHYYGSSGLIKELHSKIASVKGVPSIKQIIGYGCHNEEGIIIFKNGVWDIKERLFTRKKTDDDFYYNYDNSGYWVTDKNLNNLDDVLSTGVPELDVDNLLSYKDMIDIMEELYADNSGTFLLFMAFGMIGHLMYGDKTKAFPLMFIRGLTGSGKSQYSEILQKIWGIEKTGTDFENSTLFTMSVTLSYLIKLPYFISEYREAATHQLQKVATLRSVFDKTSQTKGRADQSVVKYDYYAMPILDGEEMIGDGALRTRSIQYQLLTKHKIKGNFSKIVRKGEPIFKNILFTYLSKSKGDKYQDYIDEGYEYFKQFTSQNRIAENISKIYAGCMVFNSEKEYEDMYKAVLSEVIDFQENDFKENSTSMQIIKVLSKFLENKYNGVHAKKDYVGISWNAIETYVTKFRIDTTLKISSYKEHLIALGYSIDFIEGSEGSGLVECVVIPYKDIHKSLLVHPEVYQAYKLWKKQNV